MNRLGFSAEDFRVFEIEGFEARMEALKGLVRPKLEKLGAELAPALREATGEEFHPHVAKHQRRTVNPPAETWVALGPSPRGYKRYGYLALAISGGGLHARVVVKSEADGRARMAANFRKQAKRLNGQLGGVTLRRYDGWDLQGLPQPLGADAQFWEECAAALAKKTGGIDLGLGWAKREALKLDFQAVVEHLAGLMPLYRLTRA
ncbi:MAG: DUF1054 family protein [Candidatus Tectomicrobia bacterium]|nr:DUF1054 family protein [Candidatus Tectomicrobia bacterium]